MIHEFTDHHPGEQSWCGYAAVDDGSRDGGCRNGFATAASILWTDVPMDGEPGRFDIQLLTDVFADLD
jgi:hypothetical protein